MSSHCITSICPHCSVGCGISLLVDGHSLVNVEPQRSHPINRGQLCQRAWRSTDTIEVDERITQPLIRQSNVFRAVSRHEAITKVCDQLKNILKKSGPSTLGIISSAHASNEDNYAAQKLARTVLKTNNIDHFSHFCHDPAVKGLQQTLGSAAVTNSTSDLASTDVIIVIDADLSWDQGILATQIIREKLKGKQLIVVTPEKTHLAKLADMHLPLKPGSHIALINAMLEEIINQSWHNQLFISQRCHGFERLTMAIAGSLDKATELTGLSLSLIRSAAKIYSCAKRAMILYGKEITAYVNGIQNVIALSNLTLVCGHMGRLGTGLNPLLRGQNNSQGVYDMGCVPSLYPGHQPVNNLNNKRFSDVWNTTLPSLPGLTSSQMIESNVAKPLRGLILFAEDLVATSTDPSYTRDVLQDLDLLVVVGMTMTETAKLADIVLPAAAFTEKDGTFTNYERRVQHIRQVFRSPGEAKAHWQWLSDIAQGIGSNLLNWHSAEEVFDEMATITPIYSGMSYYKIDRHQGLQWPCNQHYPNGSPILYTQHFPTSSGRAQLIPVHCHLTTDNPMEQTIHAT